MIRLLVKLGRWLETRFPERREVSLEEYTRLLARIQNIENQAAHKDAVKTVINTVAVLRNELSSLKTSLGFQAGTEAAKIEAYLSGEPVKGDDNVQ